MSHDASPAELRVLGCLIEKQRTTPDVYPLSLNSLRLACNQSTNRDPVVDYDESTVRDALHELTRRGWARLASSATSRAIKYRHLLDEALTLTPSDLALLAVLMLRGPQTLGELRTRAERLYPFRTLEDVEAKLLDLAGRELVVRQERRPGQKEERYRQLLGGEGEPPAATPTPPEEDYTPVAAAPPLVGPQRDERVDELEERVDHLAGQVEWLRKEVVALRDELRLR